MDPYTVVIRPLHNEKSVQDVERHNAYHFEISPQAGKSDVKTAIEELFGVNVTSVRTMGRAGKKRRSRARTVHTKSWKKAVVTLAEGEGIDLGY